MEKTDSAEKLQSVIGDNLFPQVQHISDVKQVIDSMKDTAQNLSQNQIRAILFLRDLGKNEYLHPDGSPYTKIEKFIMEGKIHVADPDYFIDVIESLIPKPPKPIIMAPDGKQVQMGRKK